MEKVKFTLMAIAIFMLTQTINAQNEGQTWNLKGDAFGLFVAQFKIGVEKKLGGQFSTQLDAGAILGGSTTTNEFGGVVTNFKTKRRGFLISSQIRYYVGQEDFSGFFVAPFVRYRFLNKDKEVTKTSDGVDLSHLETKKAFGAGVALGYKIVSERNVSYEFQLGYYWKSVSRVSDFDNSIYNAPSSSTNYETIGGEMWDQRVIDLRSDKFENLAFTFSFFIGGFL